MCSTNKALPAQTLGHWRAHLNSRAVCAVLLPTFRCRTNVLCHKFCHSRQTTRSTRLLRHQLPVLRAATGHTLQSEANHRTPLDSDDYDELDDVHNAIEQPGRQSGSAADVPGHSHQRDEAAGQPGGGFVGLFVAGWMMLLSLLMGLLSPVLSLGLFVAQPLTRTNPVRARARVDHWLPRGFWARLHYLWERPLVKSIRITASIANWSVRLPAIAALLLAQGGAMASTISFPMLAPLLLGTGMMINSIKANASFIIPRLGLLVVVMWVLWFFTNVIQTTWVVLCKQGRIDMRTLAGARMITECTSLLLAGIVVLSMLGINISALLLPAGVVLAIASRELLQLIIAGFFLVLAQPFRLGDKVAISCTTPADPSHAAAAAATTSHLSGASAAAGFNTGHQAPRGVNSTHSSNGRAASEGSSTSMAPPGWFEGVCEKVDLRYTVLRDGRRRLMVPNHHFVSREFMVYDEGPEALRTGSSNNNSSSSKWWWLQDRPTQNKEQGTAAAAASMAGSRPGEGSPGRPPAGDTPRSRPGTPGPAIVEGHMTTQLPPLAQPIFPGMHFVAAPSHAAYQPYTPVQYQQQPVQSYPYDLIYMSQQQQDPAASSERYEGWQQSHDAQQINPSLPAQQQQGGQEQQGLPHQQEAAPPGRDQAQQGIRETESREQQQQQQQPQVQAIAKGPPGYLPQGFAAGAPYLGIPVGTLYYGVPGTGLPWAHRQQAAAPAATAQSSPNVQQQQQQPHASGQGVTHGAQTPGNMQQGLAVNGSTTTTNSSSSNSSSNSSYNSVSEPQTPHAPAEHNNSDGHGAATLGGDLSAQVPRPAADTPSPAQHTQQQQQAAVTNPQPQVPPSNMHMTAGASLGFWGVAPAAMQPYMPPHSLTGVHAEYVSHGTHHPYSSSDFHRAHDHASDGAAAPMTASDNQAGDALAPLQQQQQLQESQGKGAEGPSGGHAWPAAEAEAPAGGGAGGEASTEATDSPNSSVFWAVLQELQQ